MTEGKMKMVWIWGAKGPCADSFYVLIHTDHFMRNFGKEGFSETQGASVLVMEP